MSEKKSSFEDAYSQAVIQSLKMLGPSTSSVITHYLNEKFSKRLEDTVDDPKLLSDALEVAIDGGRRIVQRQILRLLYENIGIDPPSAMTLDFESRINEAREEYRKRNF
jgi:hypothetical protein